LLLHQPIELSDETTGAFAATASPDATVLQAAAATGAAVLGSSQNPTAAHLRSQPDKPATAHKPDGPGGPVLPCGGGSGGSAAGAACASGAGSGHGIFLAMLLTLGGLAVLLSTLLRMPRAHWRPAAFIALLERPG
jgi:hypothetical protein